MDDAGGVRGGDGIGDLYGDGSNSRRGIRRVWSVPPSTRSMAM